MAQSFCVQLRTLEESDPVGFSIPIRQLYIGQRNQFIQLWMDCYWCNVVIQVLDLQVSRYLMLR